MLLLLLLPAAINSCAATVVCYESRKLVETVFSSMASLVTIAAASSMDGSYVMVPCPVYGMPTPLAGTYTAVPFVVQLKL
jgi:hypothetical protein